MTDGDWYHIQNTVDCPSALEASPRTQTLLATRRSSPNMAFMRSKIESSKSLRTHSMSAKRRGPLTPVLLIPSLSKECTGIDSVRIRLSASFSDPVKQELPKLRTDMEKIVVAWLKEMKKYNKVCRSIYRVAVFAHRLPQKRSLRPLLPPPARFSTMRLFTDLDVPSTSAGRFLRHFKYAGLSS
jgi:hypothetical protein